MKDTLIVNWNTPKGNQALIQKFKRHNRKIPKSEFFLTSVKNWCPQLTKKLNEAISPKFELNQNKSREVKINEIFIVLHLKPIPLLY